MLIVALSGTFAYDLRTNGIFACGAAGYSEGSYLAYCNSERYGDYDHGAFWFDLERDIRNRAAAADVIFLGSSRMQFAFSSETTRRYFENRGVDYYLLGFSHTENINFLSPLLASISPSAVAYIVNVDRFFDDRLTVPASTILSGEQPLSQYRRKRLWQIPHRILCRLPYVCGESLGFFRSKERGAWKFQGNDELQVGGIAEATVMDQSRARRGAELAESFLAELPVARECIFLTVVPWAETPRREAQFIADAVGIELVAPTGYGLRTFDGSHLDVESAEAWAGSYFDLAGDRIADCADGVTSAAAGAE